MTPTPTTLAHVPNPEVPARARCSRRPTPSILSASCVGHQCPRRCREADKQPTIIVVRRQAPNADTAAVLAALIPTVEELAGRPTPAIIAEDVQPPAAPGLGSVTERLGAIGLLAGLALLLLTTVIGTTIVPGL
jgi:hypothetical protein